MKVQWNRLVFLSIAWLISLSLLNCSETSKPEDEDPNPPPPTGDSAVEPEEGLRELFGSLFVHTVAGSSVVRSDGTFEVPGDTVRVRQLFIVATNEGRPVLLDYVEPESGPIRIDAETTAEALLTIDPLFWAVPEAIRAPAVELAGDDVQALAALIRSRLAGRRFEYLVDPDALGVQATGASTIRELLAVTSNEDDFVSVAPPWLEGGQSNENGPVFVNPQTIQYGIGIDRYFEDQTVTSRIAGPAILTEVTTVGPPHRTELAVSDGLYRFHVHAGDRSGWDDPDHPGTVAARSNLIAMASWFLGEVLGVDAFPPWVSDPDLLDLEGLEGITTLQEAWANGDRAEFQKSFLDILSENAGTLFPNIPRSMLAKASRLFRVRVDVTTGMVGSRFLDDLIRSPEVSEHYLRIDDRDLVAIDPPDSVRTPTNLLAHYSDGRVFLWWEDQANNEDGYSVERKEDGFFGEIGTLIEGASAYEDRRVELGHTYTYRLFAYNQAARSDPSDAFTLTIRTVEDHTPPAPVPDLSHGEIGHDRIELLWTAPGDDGWLGRATEYDIRYLTSSLNENNWESAARLVGEPRPSIVGLPERFIATGLVLDQVYFFGLVTVDEEGNRSALSNVIESRTSPYDPNEGWGPGFAPPPEGNGLNGDVWAIIDFQDDLIATGNFTFAGAEPVDYIARWDGARWHRLGMGLDSYGRSLTIYDGDLIVGGFFEHAGETPAQSVARWDGTSWSSLGLGTNGMVRTVNVFQGELIIGGNFSEAGTIPAESIARWNGTHWDSLGAGVNNQVFIFHVFEDDLIVGGDFGEAGGVPGTSEIARWDGATWSALSTGMDVDYVMALATHRGDLIAGGQFSNAGGVPASNIARWDGESWHPFGTGMDSWVRTATIYNDDLVVGGQFWHADGVLARFIARWDGDEWSPVGSGTNGIVRTVIPNGLDLIVGGGFSQAGGKPSRGIAIWRDSDR